jgi:hypothetical protein
LEIILQCRKSYNKSLFVQIHNTKYDKTIQTKMINNFTKNEFMLIRLCVEKVLVLENKIKNTQVKILLDVQ